MATFQNPASMDLLLPKEGNAALSRLTCEILKASGRLTGQVHSTQVLERIAALIREMNCYYSNLIEGHKTTPREIEQALKQDFSGDAVQNDNQLLCLAHIGNASLGGHCSSPSPAGLDSSFRGRKRARHASAFPGSSHSPRSGWAGTVDTLTRVGPAAPALLRLPWEGGSAEAK